MAGRYVRCGSWLCENAKTLNRDRRSYSSKTVLVAQQASGFNLEIELKNIILRRVSIFEFLHSQGQLQAFDAPTVEICFTLVTRHRPPDWASPFRADFVAKVG